MTHTQGSKGLPCCAVALAPLHLLLIVPIDSNRHFSFQAPGRVWGRLAGVRVGRSVFCPLWPPRRLPVLSMRVLWVFLATSSQYYLPTTSIIQESPNLHPSPLIFSQEAHSFLIPDVFSRASAQQKMPPFPEGSREIGVPWLQGSAGGARGSAFPTTPSGSGL